ncbi:universal stress protein [Streptomyces sp. NPDC005438]|uniref:universal stress protein n=1 Tax=Streptomyces sp. NPDC005438 TaxID=3156880 RepID=UPI0033B71449
MSSTTSHGDIVVGVDPARNWRPALGWAAEEARLRGRGLRLVVAVPQQHQEQRATRHTVRVETATDALRTAVGWLQDHRPEVRATPAVLHGFPSAVLAGLSRGASLIVLGSRRLSRTEEFLSAGSLVVPVTAQSYCPVAVVNDTETAEGKDRHLVVGVDGSETSLVAVGLAYEEAELRGCALRVVAVWQPPVFSTRAGAGASFETARRSLSESTAGWGEKYPEVRVSHEVLVGAPVEVLAEVAEGAGALVVGRRGQGGYSGMRVGSVVRGLLHRATCPVITVPPA